MEWEGYIIALAGLEALLVVPALLLAAYFFSLVRKSKKREAELLLLNQKNYELFAAIQAATSGIIITKANHNQRHIITFANKSFCDMFEFSQEEVLGHDLFELCRSRGNTYVVEQISTLITRQKAGTFELKYEDKYKRKYWFDLKLSPVLDEDGDLELYIGVVNDIGELKMREAEASRGQRLDALGQLSAGVAHDFNNILSIIDGYARLSIAANENNPKALEYLQKIKTASDRGANLIKRMLTFSHHKIVDDVVVDLPVVIQEQQQLLRPLLNASIKFHMLRDSTPMYVECAPDTLTQIVMNLVVNARDAMPDGGILMVEVRGCDPQRLPPELKDKSDCRYCVLSVADTGTGIEPDIVEKIFDPFFTMKGKEKGTGLGLSMVYGLMKQMGGLVKVETKVGEGTAMRLYFPTTDKSPKKITGNVEDLDSLSFAGFTVLLAEDEDDLRELVGNMLEELGMEVLRASDGHEALYLEDTYDGTIDLLLTDIVMPELNGVDLADLMSEFQPQMKVIFMSGYPANSQSARSEIPEGADFIAKPIVHEDLIQIIYNALTENDGSGQVRTSRWVKKTTPDNRDKEQVI